MRDKQEVLEKFWDLSDRALKELKLKYLSRHPINCSHNVRYKVKGKGQIGLCQNPVVLSYCRTKKVFVCNDTETACRCKLFKCVNSNESVETNFRNILRSPSRCGNDYPKLAILIWFLQDYNTFDKRTVRLSQTFKRIWFSVWNLLSCRWW